MFIAGHVIACWFGGCDDDGILLVETTCCT